MKKRLLGLMTVVLFAGATLTLTACGDDEKDEGQGNSEVADLRALVLDENGQVFFENMGYGVYQIGLESKQDATDLVALYAGSGFTGQAYTRRLADEKGTVTVAIGDDGVYYSVGFDVKGIPSFTLHLVNDGTNALSTKHTCPVCGYTWRSPINRCPRTGSKTYHPQS